MARTNFHHLYQPHLHSPLSVRACFCIDRTPPHPKNGNDLKILFFFLHLTLLKTPEAWPRGRWRGRKQLQGGFLAFARITGRENPLAFSTRPSSGGGGDMAHAEWIRAAKAPQEKRKMMATATTTTTTIEVVHRFRKKYVASLNKFSVLPVPFLEQHGATRKDSVC